MGDAAGIDCGAAPEYQRTHFPGFLGRSLGFKHVYLLLNILIRQYVVFDQRISAPFGDLKCKAKFLCKGGEFWLLVVVVGEFKEPESYMRIGRAFGLYSPGDPKVVFDVLNVPVDVIYFVNFLIEARDGDCQIIEAAS